MSGARQASLRLFQFPRILGVPNLSPFCCKLETWLRIAGIPYDAFIAAYTHLIREEGLRHTRARFESVEMPIRDFLRSQRKCVDYAERMRARFFPELAPGRDHATQVPDVSRAA